MGLPERVQALLPVHRLLAEATAAAFLPSKKIKMWCIFRGAVAQSRLLVLPPRSAVINTERAGEGNRESTLEAP
jgi:hypothetical protein